MRVRLDTETNEVNVTFSHEEFYDMVEMLRTTPNVFREVGMKASLYKSLSATAHALSELREVSSYP